MKVSVLGRLIEVRGHQANAWPPMEVRPSGREEIDCRELRSKAWSPMVVTLLGRSIEIRAHLQNA